MSTTSTTTIATMAAPLPFTNSKIHRSRRFATMIRCDVGEDSSLKIGARVRVKVPLKVYHVPKVPEVDLSGREDIQGPRGPLKFVAHLRDDEFELLE
ncbi:unnamed protein product [Vicia faba]|uniref:Ferredoxin thioredoxin reductase alpha chain domain-containing protein n=1 Tax=Vicia faba TaxID=3906 RepID=A0AAV0ZCL7_VICFA|nr:unnamed protein product [Vicia faba]